MNFKKELVLIAYVNVLSWLSGANCNNVNSLVDPPLIEWNTSPERVVNAVAGSRVVLRCEAFGIPPPTVRWLSRSPSPTHGNKAERIINYGVTTIQSAVTKSELVVDCVTEEDAGVYTCEGSNGITTISANTTLLVNAPVRRTRTPLPLILLQFLRLHDLSKRLEICQRKKKVEAGSAARISMWTETRIERPDATAQLFCRAGGIPPPAINWFLEDDESGIQQPIRNSSTYQLLENGDLLVTNPEPVDQGAFSYVCQATNEFGSDERTILFLATPLE